MQSLGKGHLLLAKVAEGRDGPGARYGERPVVTDLAHLADRRKHPPARREQKPAAEDHSRAEDQTGAPVRGATGATLWPP